MSHNRDADVTTHKVHGNEQINEVNQDQHHAKHEKSLGSKIVDKTKDALETSKEKIVGAAHAVKDTVSGHKHHDKHHHKHDKDREHLQAIQQHDAEQTFQGQRMQGQGLQGQDFQGQDFHGQGQGFQGQGLGLQGQGIQGQGLDSAQGRSDISSVPLRQTEMDSGKQDWQKTDISSGLGTTDANQGRGMTDFDSKHMSALDNAKQDSQKPDTFNSGASGLDANQGRGITNFDSNQSQQTGLESGKQDWQKGTDLDMNRGLGGTDFSQGRQGDIGQQSWQKPDAFNSGASGLDANQGRTNFDSNQSQQTGLESGKQDWQKGTDLDMNRGLGGTDFSQGRQGDIGQQSWQKPDTFTSGIQDRGMTGFDANKGLGSSNLGGGLNDKKL